MPSPVGLKNSGPPAPAPSVKQPSASATCAGAAAGAPSSTAQTANPTRQRTSIGATHPGRCRAARAIASRRTSESAGGAMATATGQQVQVRDKLYIGGEWVDPAGSRRARGRQLGHRGGHGQRSRRARRRTSTAPSPAAREAFEAWSRRAVDERAELAARDRRRRSARAQEEIAALIAQEVGMPIKLSQHDPGRAADDDLRLDAAVMAEIGLGGGGRQLAGRARAGRRRRRDHAVELPAAPDRREGRAGAGGGLHGGAQAQRGRAAQRLHPGRGARRARPAGRRLQPRHRPSARSSARRSPPTPTSTWSRSPARPRAGQARQRAGRRDGQARRARARRQVGRT